MSTDILKQAFNDGLTDPHGYMAELGDWSESHAEETAREEHIELTPGHWEVVNFLRNDYSQHGPAENARAVLNRLTEEYQDQGGSKYLYTLFPQGPVRQASRIAGLPVPPHSEDPSFGTVQ